MGAAFERVDLDISRQVNPQFIPAQITFPVGKTNFVFTHTVDFGFGYFLRHLVIEYPYTMPYVSDGQDLLAVTGPVNLEFFIVRVSRQAAPVPSHDLATPANSNGSMTVEDMNYHNWPVFQPFKATAPLSHKTLNLYYTYGETLQINFSRPLNDIDTASLDEPAPALVVNLVLKGYVVPNELSGGF